MALNGMMLHCGGKNVTLAELEALPKPERVGPRHRPEPHHRFVGMFMDCLGDVGLNLDSLDLGLAGDKGERLFFTATVTPTAVSRLHNKLVGQGQAFQIVGRKGNAGQVALKMFAGLVTFVCDNMMISGDSLLVHKRQTLNLCMEEELMAALMLYTEQAGSMVAARQAAGALPLDDQEAKALILDLITEKVIPGRLAHEIVANYFSPTDAMTDCHPRSFGGLFESCTRAYRPLSAERKLKATQETTSRLVYAPSERELIVAGPVEVYRPTYN